MMELKQFYRKKVKIVATNGRVFRGKVSDYVDPEDNEPEEESIIVDTVDGQAVEFYEKDIKEIEVTE